MKEPDEIVEILVDLSVKSKLRGLLSLQEDENETSILFLRRALGFLVDAYPSHQIKDFLNTEMYFFRLRREESERVLRTMAEICPAFGIVGSVVGLISMLVGVGDSSAILATAGYRSKTEETMPVERNRLRVCSVHSSRKDLCARCPRQCLRRRAATQPSSVRWSKGCARTTPSSRGSSLVEMR